MNRFWCMKPLFLSTVFLLIGFVSGCEDNSTDDESNSMYRGDMQRTGFFKSDETSASMKVLWQKDAGEIVDSPTLVDGVIYYADRNYTYAIKESETQELWSYRSKPNGNFSVAVSRGLVITSDHDNVIALDKQSGQKKWTFEPDAALTLSDISEPLRRGISSPAVNRDSVFFTGTDGSVYSLDILSGSENWQFKAGEATLGAVAISDSTLFFGSHSNFYALDVSTGNEMWRSPIQGGKMDSTPSVGNGLVYFNDGMGMLHAFDCSSGEEVWNFQGAETAFASSPANNEGTVFIGTSEGFHAIDGRTGVQKWAIQISKGGAFASPIATTKLVFFVGLDGVLYAINRTSGDIVSTIHVGDVVLSTPVINDGVIYIGNSDGLWAVSISDFN